MPQVSGWSKRKKCLLKDCAKFLYFCRPSLPLTLGWVKTPGMMLCGSARGGKVSRHRARKYFPCLHVPVSVSSGVHRNKLCPCTHPCWLVDKRLQTPYQLHPTHGGLPFDGCRAKNQEFQAQRTADTETHLPCLQWEVGPSSAALVDQLSHESVALTTRLGSMHSSLLVLTIYGSLIYGLDLK